MSSHTRTRISARRASTFLFVPSVLILGSIGCSAAPEPPEDGGFSFGGTGGTNGTGTGMSGGTVGTGGTPVGNGGSTGVGGTVGGTTGGTGGMMPSGNGGTPPTTGGTGGIVGNGGSPPVGQGGMPPGNNGGMGPSEGGSGNMPPLGGAPNGGAPDTGSGGSAPTGACTFDVKASLSTAIGTVGIVEWSVSGLPSVESAEIEFELVNPANDEMNRGGKAPVSEPKASGNRTLLLGLKGNRDYTFRVVASGGGTSCQSDSQSIKTGPVANSVPSVQVSTNNAGARAGGFIITSGGVGNLGGPGGGGGNSPVFILDADGDVVWWFSAPNQTSRAHMSWEGTDMWMMALNVQNTGGQMRRVSMDGLDVQMSVSGLEGGHHDFTVAPGGVVTVISWTSAGTDPPSHIIERSPDGMLKTVATLDSKYYAGGQSAFGGSGTFHANAIHFHLGNPDDPSDDAYTISDRNPNLFIKIKRSGELLWQFGGSNPVGKSFMVAGGTWQVNHGHHLQPNGNFLFFNNGNFGGQSMVLEYKLDETSWTAQKVWEYRPPASPTLGDAQRLPNGNTLVTSSSTGTIQEVTSGGQVIQEFKTASLGYADWRPTLYGPPAR